jgi:hypothetical protein
MFAIDRSADQFEGQKTRVAWVMNQPEPIFHVILTDRDKWAVEAEWPDMTLERIRTFASHAAATEWIIAESTVWLRNRSSGLSFLVRDHE